MIRRIKDYIRTKPTLYDLGTRSKRALGWKTPSYDFFDSLSRALDYRVRFVQIGANDGLRNDPIREFIRRDDWTGVLVEPLPAVFELLKANYRSLRKRKLIFVNAAVSDETDEAVAFWTFKEEYLVSLPHEQRLDLLRKASFNKQHVLRYVAPEIADRVLEQMRLPCYSMMTLVERYCANQTPDLLVIDAEGHESTIIKNIDFNRFRPDVIFFESHNLGREQDALSALLTSQGYKLTNIAGDTAACTIKLQSLIGLPT